MLALRPRASSEPPELISVPRPSVPQDHVLVKVHATAINPSDILNAKGSFNHGGTRKTLGRDYAGIVEEGPADVVGREVYGTSGKGLSFEMDGAQAEYCVIPSTCVSLKPPRLTFAQAATVGVPFTTAALALHRAGAKAGDVVLIVGASGAVGSALSQLGGGQMGCHVVRAARHGDVDVNLVSDPEMLSVNHLTKGRCPDIAVDTTGSPDLMHAALKCLAPGGRLSYISAPRTGSTDFTFDLLHVYREQKSIVGCNSVSQDQSETARELTSMYEGFENGSLEAANDDSFPKISLQEAPDAYALMMSGGARKKYVIVFESQPRSQSMETFRTSTPVKREASERSSGNVS